MKEVQESLDKIKNESFSGSDKISDVYFDFVNNLSIDDDTKSKLIDFFCFYGEEKWQDGWDANDHEQSMQGLYE